MLNVVTALAVSLPLLAGSPKEVETTAAGHNQFALDLYRQPTQWRRLQQNGMRQSFDWSDSAGHYLALYST